MFKDLSELVNYINNIKEEEILIKELFTLDYKFLKNNLNYDLNYIKNMLLNHYRSKIIISNIKEYDKQLNNTRKNQILIDYLQIFSEQLLNLYLLKLNSKYKFNIEEPNLNLNLNKKLNDYNIKSLDNNQNLNLNFDLKSTKDEKYCNINYYALNKHIKNELQFVLIVKINDYDLKTEEDTNNLNIIKLNKIFIDMINNFKHAKYYYVSLDYIKNNSELIKISDKNKYYKVNLIN